MNRYRRSLLWSLLFGLTAVPASAKAQSFQLIVTYPAQNCTWTGPAFTNSTTIHPGCVVDFVGSAQLTRVAGGVGCSPTLTGTVSGTLSGTSLAFGIATTEAGTVTFNGTVSPGGLLASGTWSGPMGTGNWTAVSDLDFQSTRANLTVMQPGTGCQWTGPINAIGGLTFTGSVDLIRAAAAPTSCPATLTGSLAGVYLQPAICFTLTSTELGDLDFGGTVDIVTQSAAGTWSGNLISGTWTGQIGLPPVQPAPSLSAAGLAFLGGTLLLAGVQSVRRRKSNQRHLAQ